MRLTWKYNNGTPKIINLLDNTPNKLSKFKTKNWVEINDDTRGMYNTNSQIKFKTSMLNSSLCDYSDAYILVNGTILVSNIGTTAAPNNRKNKVVKNCTPFTDYITEINNTQIDNAKDTDVVIPMYNLIEYCHNHVNTSSLWQYYRDEAFSDANGAIADFPADNNNSASFKFKTKIAGRIENNGEKDIKIMAPLNCLSNF